MFVFVFLFFAEDEITKINDGGLLLLCNLPTFRDGILRETEGIPFTHASSDDFVVHSGM